MLFKTFHNFKAPVKVLILNIGCFHRDIPFANNIYTLSDTIPALENTASGGLPVVVLQGSVSPCLSDHDEYSDPLEIAASAGARLSAPEKAGISQQRKVQTNPAEKKRSVRGSVDPNVCSWDRVKEFKDQCLIVVSGKS